MKLSSPNPDLRHAALALGVACSLLIACGEEATAPGLPEQVVIVSPVEERRLEVRIRASGDLQAREEAQIASEIEGRITELLHEEGSAVSADDVVIRIDPERRQLEVDSAEASVAETNSSRREAGREHKRLLALQKRGAASAAQLDSAASALEAANSRHRAAKAQLGVAHRALRDADVAAPFAGIISRRYVSRGEYVGPGKALFELVANDPLDVIFHLSEADSARVALDNPVELQVASHPGEIFKATVTMLSPTIDERTRTLRVKAALDNREGKLRPGLFAHVDLGVNVRERVTMIPEEAVLQRASGPITFVIDQEGRAAQRSVATGMHQTGSVEVTDGLEAGDWVITQGHSRLVDGMAVTAKRANGDPFDRLTARTSPGSEVAIP